MIYTSLLSIVNLHKTERVNNYRSWCLVPSESREDSTQLVAGGRRGVSHLVSVSKGWVGEAATSNEGGCPAAGRWLVGFGSSQGARGEAKRTRPVFIYPIYNNPHTLQTCIGVTHTLQTRVGVKKWRTPFLLVVPVKNMRNFPLDKL